MPRTFRIWTKRATGRDPGAGKDGRPLMALLFGYHGKVPAAPDFAFQGLPARTADGWAARMAEWMAAGRDAAGGQWTERFLGAPLWRFAISKGHIGSESWVGVLASSVDSIGRTFPFTVMVSVDLDPGTCQPISLLDPQLDRVEGHLLSFIEGHISRESLMRLVAEVRVALKGKLQERPAQGIALLPAPDDEAVCLSGHAMPGLAADGLVAFRWASSPVTVGSRGLCLWWHDAYGNRPPEFCVTRGFTRAANPAPFFLGDWQGHGWTQCNPEDYLEYRENGAA
jgi:type VI secretion system protein ImpM